MDWAQLGKEFGLIGIALGSVLTMFFFILKWVLAQFKEELTGNRKERSEYICTLNNINANIAEHNARAKEFQTNVQAEHKEMIISLGRINGYKTE
jgi:hypothetical protein